MPYQDALPLMYLTYVLAGAGFLLAVSIVLIRLFLAHVRPHAPSRRLTGQEFVWTLVPVLVLLGLTFLGEIPRGWVKSAASPGAIHAQDRTK
jgi:hypothetical protein